MGSSRNTDLEMERQALRLRAACFCQLPDYEALLKDAEKLQSYDREDTEAVAWGELSRMNLAKAAAEVEIPPGFRKGKAKETWDASSMGEQAADYISLALNELFWYRDPSDGDEGWAYGRSLCHEKYGWFPPAYVEPHVDAAVSIH